MAWEQYEPYLNVLPYLLAGLIATLLFTPWVNLLARRFHVIRFPPSLVHRRPSPISVELDSKELAASRRLEKPPVPEWGGIAYVLPFVIISLLGLGLASGFNLGSALGGTLFFFFLAVILLFAVGIIDDKYELSGSVQLLAHFVAALLLALAPNDLEFVNNPFSGGNIDLLSWQHNFTILGIDGSFAFPGDLLLMGWVLLLIMPVKALAGTDGLMEGNVLIASIFISLVSIRFQQDASAHMAAIFAGCLAGFLFFNFYPAKIWSGSSGKSVVGFIIAGLSFISGSKFAVTLMIFLLPIFDFTWVVLQRLWIHRPKQPWKILSISDQLHLHHRLMSLGWGEKKMAYFEYGLTFLISLFAFALTGLYKAVVLMIVGGIIAAMILWFTYRSNRQKRFGFSR